MQSIYSVDSVQMVAPSLAQRNWPHLHAPSGGFAPPIGKIRPLFIQNEPFHQKGRRKKGVARGPSSHSALCRSDAMERGRRVVGSGQWAVGSGQGAGSREQGAGRTEKGE